MTIDFISDLHLDKTRPEVNKYFINYLDNINKDVTFYLDKSITEFDLCNFHPLDNTKTIQVLTKDFLSFINTITKIKLIDFEKKEILEI